MRIALKSMQKHLRSPYMIMGATKINLSANKSTTNQSILLIAAKGAQFAVNL